MGFFGMFGAKKGPSPKEVREMLPSLHSFIDASIRNGPRGSVCFENVGTKTFVTSTMPGMTAGQTVSFVYQNARGKFRFSAPVTALDGKQATFAIPSKIETIQKFHGAHHRTTLRVDTTVTVQWRYAITGKIEAEWQKGVVSDISRTGAQLTAEKEIKVGNTLELRLPLLVNGDTVEIRSEARRVEKLESLKKYSIGLRFLLLKPDAERAIIEFINRRQTDLRSRGLG